MTIQANFPTIKPSLMLDFANTKQLDSRITYTRASTASYYDGVTTSKAEENLVTYSQEFDNAAWATQNSTITANSTTAPDGTTTAETVTEAATTNVHNLRRFNYAVQSSTTYTASVYVKPNGRSIVYIDLTHPGVANYRTWFDISAGTVLTSAGGNTGTITSAGSGWFRIAVSRATASNQTNQTFEFGPTTADNTSSYLGDGTSGIFIWGAQLEIRSSVTAYTATTTQAITNYIPKLQSAASGVARFDNNPTTGESLGLLIEESRTNLLNYSSQFDNAYWNKTRATITADTVVAPDGTLTGDFITTNGTAGNKNIFVLSFTTPAANSIYTASIFAKNNGSSGLFQIELGSGANQAIGTFNLSTGAVGTFTVNGTVTACSGTITAVGNNWYRCSIVVTHGASWSGATNIAFYDLSTQTASTVTGMFLWGAQVELGAFATSYIPTVASQVTRAADVANITGTNFTTWFNTAQGTMYSEFMYYSAVNAKYVISGNDGSSSTRWIESGGNTNQFRAYDGGVLNFATFTPMVSAKAAVATDNLTMVGCGNGGTVASTTGLFPGLAARTLSLGIGNYLNGFQLNGTIKKIAYYPIKLSNSNLQALTS